PIASPAARRQRQLPRQGRIARRTRGARRQRRRSRVRHRHRNGALRRMSMLHALYVGALTLASRALLGPPGTKSFSARPRLELEETPESLKRRQGLAQSVQAREARRADDAPDRYAMAA